MKESTLKALETTSRSFNSGLTNSSSHMLGQQLEGVEEGKIHESVSGR